MTDKQEKPQNVFNFDYTNEAQTRPPQDYYDNIKNKYADERDLRLGYRPPGTDGYTSDLTGDLAKYAVDPYGDEVVEREVIDDSVEVKTPLLKLHQSPRVLLKILGNGCG